MSRAMRIGSLCFALFVSMCAAASSVFAQDALSTERAAAARSLFEEGVQLAENHRLGQAADRFRRSIAIQPVAAARFNLATVESDLGHFATAMELFAQLAADATVRPSVREEARRRASALRARIARLRIELAGHPSGATVHIDERQLPPEAIGVALPVDPGLHRVEARRGTIELVGRNVRLAEAESRSLTLRVPAPSEPPLIEAWWLWTIVGVVVVGAALGIGLGIGLSSAPMCGNVPPGCLPVP